MYIYIYVYICVYIHIYMYICIYIYTCVYVRFLKWRVPKTTFASPLQPWTSPTHGALAAMRSASLPWIFTRDSPEISLGFNGFNDGFNDG